MSRIVKHYDCLNDFQKSSVSQSCANANAVVAARFGKSVAFIAETELSMFVGRKPNTMTLWTADKESITSILQTFSGSPHLSCDGFTASLLDRPLLESVAIPTLTIIGPSRIPYWFVDPIAFQRIDPFIAIWSPDKQETFISYQPLCDVKNIPMNAQVYTRPFRV